MLLWISGNQPKETWGFVQNSVSLAKNVQNIGNCDSLTWSKSGYNQLAKPNW